MIWGLFVALQKSFFPIQLRWVLLAMIFLVCYPLLSLDIGLSWFRVLHGQDVAPDQNHAKHFSYAQYVPMFLKPCASGQIINYRDVIQYFCKTGSMPSAGLPFLRSFALRQPQL